MKRKHHLILLAIITMLSFCGCGKESVEKTDPAQDESPATTYTVVDESEAKPETNPVDIPLEVTFETKKCENYESESVMPRTQNILIPFRVNLLNSKRNSSLRARAFLILAL